MIYLIGFIYLLIVVFVAFVSYILFKNQSKIVSNLKVGDKVRYGGLEGEIISINGNVAEIKFKDFPLMRISK